MPQPVGQYPDAELVTSAWIASIPGIQIDAVDHELPWDLPVNVNLGYVQVTVIGGTPSSYAAFFRSMVQVDSWVSAPSEDRVYRLQASNIAKTIQLASIDRKAAERGVAISETLPEGGVVTYPNAHVYTAECLTEPHRMVSKDNPMYEGYSMDLMFTWAWNISTP